LYALLSIGIAEYVHVHIFVDGILHKKIEVPFLHNARTVLQSVVSKQYIWLGLGVCQGKSLLTGI